jgi:uncharacterized repeat protein (TIGR03803 family)
MKTRLVVIAVLFTLVGTAVVARAGDKETVLYEFSGRANGDGFHPVGQEAMDAQGNIYGVANEGGVSGQCCGLIYELSPTAAGGYSYNVIYTFTGIGADFFPESSLTIDTAGNLYGSTQGAPYGEVYELSPNGSGGWTETVLYVETISYWGIGNLAVDASGNLFGTGGFGGKHNKGFVFALLPSGGTATFEDLFDFDGTNGASPSGVTVNATGNVLYGTTAQGGTSTNCTNGCGVVFKVEANGYDWLESVLMNFNGANGSLPETAPTTDGLGNLYGTAVLGGSKGFGIVFELTPNGSGGWTQHILHSFSDANGDGSEPNTTLVLYDGAVYGTTLSGGNSGCATVINNFDSVGCGTVFELTLSGARWSESLLHSFSGLRDGGFPQGVIVDANGNLFGATIAGGDQDNQGVTFEMTAD